MPHHHHFLYTLSPAKKLQTQTVAPHRSTTSPLLFQQALALVTHLKTLSVTDLEKLMRISPKLARLNQQRFQDFPESLQPNTCGAAIDQFSGDVYQKLDAWSLGELAQARLADQVFILSGLYGLLRPFDRLFPYRLEMGTPTESLIGTRLYGYWQSKLTEVMNQVIQNQGFSHHLSLASEEYAKALPDRGLSIPTIRCKFLEQTSRGLRTIGVNAKRARGLLLRFCLTQEKPLCLDDLKRFNGLGYGFSDDQSTDQCLVYIKT